jgi:hypothetical protein
LFNSEHYTFISGKNESVVFNTVQTQQQSLGRAQLASAGVSNVFAYAENDSQKSLTLCE